MKVIYAKPIHEAITEARIEARQRNKEIEKIILTQGEYAKLRREMSRFTVASRLLVSTSSVLMFDGIELEVEGSEF